MAMSRAASTCPVPDCFGWGKRDIQAELFSDQKDFTYEVHSEALGIHPSQIREAQQKFPHHRYLSDGRMVIGSLGERNRIARDLGFDPG